MSCPNCKIFHARCDARCCSLVPIDRATYMNNLHLIQRPVNELAPFLNDTIVPLTEDAHCPFLRDNLECAIYDHRPEICRIYGNETHINLTCEFQTKDGNERPKKDRKRISKLQTGQMKKYFGTNLTEKKC